MELFLHIRRGAAKVLRRCADAIAPETTAAGPDIGPDPLAALRLRYPGAPEVWLRALATAAPATPRVSGESAAPPAPAAAPPLPDTAPSSTFPDTAHNRARTGPTVDRTAAPAPEGPRALQATRQHPRPQFMQASCTVDRRSQPAPAPASAGHGRRAHPVADFAPDAGSRPLAPNAAPAFEARKPDRPPRDLPGPNRPLPDPALPASGRPGEMSTPGSAGGATDLERPYVAPVIAQASSPSVEAAGTARQQTTASDVQAPVPSRAPLVPPAFLYPAENPPRSAPATVEPSLPARQPWAWQDVPPARPAPLAPLTGSGRKPGNQTHSPVPGAAAMAIETLWPVLPADPAEAGAPEALARPLGWAAPRPEQEARTWTG